MVLFLIPILFQTLFPLNTLGKFAQIFTTVEPDKENVELALAAVEALERDENMKNGSGYTY